MRKISTLQVNCKDWIRIYVHLIVQKLVLSSWCTLNDRSNHPTKLCVSEKWLQNHGNTDSVTFRCFLSPLHFTINSSFSHFASQQQCLSNLCHRGARNKGASLSNLGEERGLCWFLCAPQLRVIQFKVTPHLHQPLPYIWRDTHPVVV